MIKYMLAGGGSFFSENSYEDSSNKGDTLKCQMHRFLAKRFITIARYVVHNSNHPYFPCSLY
jgi:hypothetical protein